jgi:hypothetical protein
MKLAVMQPYFLPYVGYFQLIAAVDCFVVYDNIKYTKKGWINRNRMLQNAKEAVFTLPLKAGSDALDIRDRELAKDFNRERLLRQFKEAYRAAPFFNDTCRLMDEVLRCDEDNLFRFLRHSIVKACRHLGIQTPITTSSSIPIDHRLRGEEKVLALCAALGADVYINAIGGIDLYSRDEFRVHGVELKFIKSNPFTYPQHDNEFIPWLSILDVLMFNPVDVIRQYLDSGYELV